MLQHYYATEKPLPTGKALHRMLRAQDRTERDAIDAVAAQFWTETADGLVNGRADAEITKAGVQAETNRAIAQAREAKRKATREQHAQSTNRATNAQPNQTPDTRHQTPDLNPPPATAEVVGGGAATPAGLVCMALKRAGIGDVNPGNATLRALIDAGATVEEFTGFAPQAVSGGKGFAWILGAVKGERTRAASTAGQLHRGPMPQQQRQPTAAEQRVLDAVPSIAAPHLRRVDPANVIDLETNDVTPRALG